MATWAIHDTRAAHSVTQRVTTLLEPHNPRWVVAATLRFSESNVLVSCPKTRKCGRRDHPLQVYICRPRVLRVRMRTFPKRKEKQDKTA